MKILHITDGIPPLTLGGTGSIVCTLARCQATRGHTVAILSAAPAGSPVPVVEGVEIHSIPELPVRWAHWRCVFSRQREREVLQAIDEFKPDVIHAHTVSRQCGYRWMPAVRKRGITLVITCHDVSHVSYGKVTGQELGGRRRREIELYRWTWNPFRHLLIRRYANSANHILAVSKALHEYLRSRKFRVDATLHNGIDTSFWQPKLSKGESRQHLGLPPDQFFFLLAGRMGYEKGSTLVAATLPENAQLLLAADAANADFDPIRDRLRLFLHQDPDGMRLLYDACDAVLVPSRCLDCFPTVCLEGMAMGKPVLATSWGGAKESVIDGQNGWIIDPLNESAWRGRMEFCMRNASVLAEMGQRGRKRAEAEFDVSRMADALEKIYSDIQ